MGYGVGDGSACPFPTFLRKLPCIDNYWSPLTVYGFRIHVIYIANGCIENCMAPRVLVECNFDEQETIYIANLL